MNRRILKASQLDVSDRKAVGVAIVAQELKSSKHPIAAAIDGDRTTRIQVRTVNRHPVDDVEIALGECDRFVSGGN